MICKKCGTDMQGNSEICSACGETAIPLNGKKIYWIESNTDYILFLKKKFLLFLGITITAIVAVIVALSVIISILTRVDVTDYLKIRVSGYEGKGTLHYEFDSTQLAMDMFDCDSYRDLTTEQKMTVSRAVSLLENSIVVYGGYNDLSNGDKIKIRFKNLDEISEKIDYKFKNNNEITYIVSKLSEPEKIDFNSIFDTKFKGYDGKGIVKLIEKKDVSLPFTFEYYDGALYVDGYTFHLTTSGNEGYLSNGDTFTIEISSGEASQNYLLEQYGICFDDSENEYEVSELLETDTLDIFSNVNLSVTGLDGHAETKIEWKSETFSQGGITVKVRDKTSNEFEIYSDFYEEDYPLQVLLSDDSQEDYTSMEQESIGTFYIIPDKTYDISGGDTVTFSILDYDSKINKNAYEKYGFVFSDVEKELTVDSDNLSRYVTSSDQINTDIIKEFSENISDEVKEYIIDNWAKVVHDTYKFNSYDKKINDDFAATEAYLVCTDKSSNSYSIWVLYTGTAIDSELESGKNIYITIEISNPAISGGDNKELIIDDTLNMTYYKDADDIKSTSWYKNNNVTVFDLEEGTVEQAVKEQKGTVKIDSGYLNVRETPDSNGKLVGKLNKGDEVVVIGESDDGKWLDIEGEKVSGYVAEEFIKLD